MPYHVKFSLYLLFILGISDVHSQPSQLHKKDIVFEHPNDNLELSQQSINSIIQDKDGFLWIGTWTGLILYDGYTTKVFQSDNTTPGALKSNKITSLFEDKKGNIWIGSMMGGLYKYEKNKNSFTQYKHDKNDPYSISNDNIWSIIQDKTGKLWVGTEDGLNHFDPETGKSIRYKADPNDDKSLSFNFITSLYLDNSNNLWIGTEYGINKLDLSNTSKGFTQYPYLLDEKSNLLHNYIYKITSYLNEDKEEIICWSTKKGFKMIDNNNIVDYQIENRSASFSFFRDIYSFSQQGNYLLLGSEMGLTVFDIKKKEFTKFFGDYDETVKLSHNTVSSIFVDRTGVLWVGTKKGLNKFDTYNNNFELYLTSAFDPNKSIITGIQQMKNGSIWISTMGGGIYRFNDDAEDFEGEVKSLFTKYKIKTNQENDFADFIQKLHTDRNGNLWIGTAGGGVYAFNVNDISSSSNLITNYTHFNVSGDSGKALSDNYIMAFEESDDNGIWVGTWSEGLNKILPNGNVIIYDHPALENIPIVFLYEDSRGVLWIGTRGKGLIKASFIDNKLVAAKQFRHNTENGSISNDFINTIFEDHNGKFWVGTEGGLNYFDPRNESFELLRLNNNANTEVVEGILEDADGKLWLSHWKGITVIDPDKKNNIVINEFDVRDRIQGGFFYNNVCLKDKLGNLYFGGSNGFNIIYPAMVNKNPYKPQVELIELRLFDQPIALNKEYNERVILNKSLSETKKITLRHFENSLSLEFAGMHYSVPEKNQYAYRLKGFEDDWKISSAERRYATYTNLPDGKYVFQLKASNSDGIWTNSLKELKIEINPPWYKTWLARLGYALVVLAILYLFRRFIIIRTNYVNNIRLERINRENIEKLNKAKLQFFTNVSHEFRTPLTLILGPLEKLINSGEGGKPFKDQLGIVNRNAQRLLRLVNQLLDFRKAEAGKLKLKVTEGDIVKFLKEVKLSFDGIAEQKNIKFIFRTSSNAINLFFDRDQFEKIFFNLLSNAFNHTADGGEIIIEASETKEAVFIKVEDNGSGIKQENFKKIFRRFYSEDDPSHQGTGIGLALTKSLVELHKGKITVESNENEFSRFTVEIPLGCQHFKESELLDEYQDSELIQHYYDLNKEEIITEDDEFDEKVDSKKLKRILIVEDNPEVRAYIKSIFFRQNLVLEAGNGLEGIKLAEEECPDLIISDVMMPGLDGINFCRQIKENVKTSHIPVILLTARTSLIFKIEGLENGADDYITKPFNNKELQLKVRNLINSRELLKKSFTDNEVLNIEPKKVTLSSTDETFIKNALESIERNMSNSEYSVEALCKDVGMSRMQLYRKLKAITGQSANEFIRTIRLKRAAQLLVQNQLSIAEVTYEVGFTDLQYFRKCFKKQFNTNPSEYSGLGDLESLEDTFPK